MSACNAPALDDLDYAQLFIQPKIDGLRCVVLDGVAYSKSMTPLPNRLLQSLLGIPRHQGYDMEVTAATMNDPLLFNKTTSAVMNETWEGLFQFYVHDIFRPQTPFVKRLVQFDPLMGSMHRTPTVHIRGRLELESIYSKCLEDGYEGAILRDGRMHYKFGKSTIKEQALMKLKPFVDGEAVVIGFQELELNDNDQIKSRIGLAKRRSYAGLKRRADTLGALLVRDCVTGVRFNIGSGFTTEQRKEIWENMREYLGKIARYKRQKYGELNLPRQGIWTGWRDPMDMVAGD